MFVKYVIGTKKEIGTVQRLNKIYVNREIIYDLPAADYHKLERLSASGIKKILVSAQDFYQSSWLNPNKREVKSDAFNLGTAYHTRILEGSNEFRRRYAIKPDCDRRTTEGKSIYNQWKNLYPNAEEIDQNTFNDINSAAEYIENNFDYFKGGNSELSILWEDEETGVPMKARLDYLKPGLIPDLKTFSNTSGMDIDRLLARHIVQYKYHVQAEVYRSLFPDHDFVFVFQQVGGVNNCIVKPFPSDLLLADKGRYLMRVGINKFADCYRKFGSTQPWIDEFDIKPFTDECFPIYALEE